LVAETPIIQHPTSSVMKNKYRILKIAVTVIILGFLLSFSLRRFYDTSMEKVSVKTQPTSRS
jgi:cell division protein FtsQ